ncbi:MAG: hypothetical protein KDD67_13320 [Ignavibacteriae bacterium]|nr:hypothetical protein [Ignavibacteriota bacterium]MCB9217079.1 hypothetical protein [Ignavibacteria bacterium]
MEQTLRALYRLQQIDLELDDLEAGSGDLPGEIRQLETNLAEVQSRISEHESTLSTIRRERNTGNEEMQELRARALELNERLRTVRNNKEYDATTTEIAAAEERSKDLGRSLSTLDDREAEILREIQGFEKSRNEITATLEDKNETLNSIHESSSDEVDEYRAQRVAALKELSAELLERYSYVRTKHPDAVVKVRKGACSGCFRAVTPQTLVEMRRKEQIFFCEHCGRLIVDEELADTVEV